MKSKKPSVKQETGGPEKTPKEVRNTVPSLKKLNVSNLINKNKSVQGDSFASNPY